MLLAATAAVAAAVSVQLCALNPCAVNCVAPSHTVAITLKPLLLLRQHYCCTARCSATTKSQHSLCAHMNSALHNDASIELCEALQDCIQGDEARKVLTYRIFLSLSRSSRSFCAMFCANVWPDLPVFQSRCLFKNQSGTLNWRGFWMIATSFSISSAVRSPALLLRCNGASMHVANEVS
jgi:hypothetical protein